MERKKIITGIGILLTLFLVLLLWPNKKKGGDDQKRTFEMAKTGNYLNPEVKLPDYLDKPKEINWIIKGAQLPKSMVIYKTNGTTISEEEIKKFVKLVGLDYESRKTMEGGTLLLFNSEDYKYETSVDLKSNKFRYSENIYGRSALNNMGTIDIEEIKRKLAKLTSELMTKETRIETEDIDYQEIIQPRWVSTTMNRAQAVEIRANYIVNDYPLKGYNGNPVKALYTRDGRLIKLEMEKFPEKWERAKEEETIDMETLRGVETGLFRVWRVEGNKDYQLKIEDEMIKKANLTNLNLGYIYIPEEMRSRPFYFIEGNSWTDKGLVKLTLIFPATKSEER